MSGDNGCCPNDEVTDVRDFSVNLGGARGYLERIGILTVVRNPRPRIVPSLLSLHTQGMKAPYPDPETTRFRMGEPSPDRLEAEEWPYTEEELG